MTLPAAVRKYLKANARNGGRKRWRGKSKAQKSAHGKAMAEARWGKNGA